MAATKQTAQRTDALLRDVVRLYLQAQRATMACCTDATARSCEALTIIAGQEGLTVQAFATQMGLEKTWASRLVSRMEKDGLIRRVDHPGDSRSWLLELTPRGKAEQRKLSESAGEHALNLLCCVPAAERANVERALEHLRKALTTCLAQCGDDKCGC